MGNSNKDTNYTKLAMYAASTIHKYWSSIIINIKCDLSLYRLDLF
jgi:hypothetical protein